MIQKLDLSFKRLAHAEWISGLMPYALQRVTSIFLFSKSISVFGYRFDIILDDTDLNRIYTRNVVCRMAAVGQYAKLKKSTNI